MRRTGYFSSCCFHDRSEEHTSELQSHSDLVCRLPLTFPPFPYTTLFRSLADDCRFHDRSAAPSSFGRIRRGPRISDDAEFSRAFDSSVPATRSDACANPCGAPDTSAPVVSMTDRKSTRLNSSHTVISYAVFPSRFRPFPTRRSSDLSQTIAVFMIDLPHRRHSAEYVEARVYRMMQSSQEHSIVRFPPLDRMRAQIHAAHRILQLLLFP